MACEECINLDIPERLCSDGKALDIPVDPKEFLYRRTPDVLDGDLTKLDIKIVERLFALLNDSYNRSEFSNPEDVLIDEFGVKYPNNGIIAVNLIDFNKEMVFNIANEPKQVKFEAVFDPKACNYAHCEVWSFVNDTRIEGNKPPKSARAFFRKQILSRITIVKQAVAS